MVVKSAIKQFEIYLVKLDPTKGGEIRKTRPCLVTTKKQLPHLLDLEAQGLGHGGIIAVSKTCGVDRDIVFQINGGLGK